MALEVAEVAFGEEVVGVAVVELAGIVKTNAEGVGSRIQRRAKRSPFPPNAAHREIRDSMKLGIQAVLTRTRSAKTSSLTPYSSNSVFTVLTTSSMTVRYIPGLDESTKIEKTGRLLASCSSPLSYSTSRF